MPIPHRALVFSTPPDESLEDLVAHALPRMVQALRGPGRRVGRHYVTHGSAVVELNDHGHHCRLIVGRDLDRGQLAARIEVEDALAARLSLLLAAPSWLVGFWLSRTLIGGGLGDAIGIVGGLLLGFVVAYVLFRLIRAWRHRRSRPGSRPELIAEHLADRLRDAMARLSVESVPGEARLPGFDGRAPTAPGDDALARGDEAAWTRVLGAAVASLPPSP
jgi:hypothetical protein